MESNVNESLYKEIVNDMLEGVMLISMKGRITMLNPAAEKILGITRQNGNHSCRI
ncbi:MAG: PAS domain S-box protein [Lachnospiraceae bacterium]|nr:PAS domain S-box protein [Lachnospiraceae bacterium]MBQ2405165.1 PAS domain S-box protein [Lachnospiraceae bacterium]MEE0919993.1 PAS domain-containing protein [Lachnospiraceae bacterium]